jgi:hypothetical protein
MPTPKQDTLTPNELAESYGWTVALFNSSGELNRLFREAVKGVWSPEEFQARLRATKWYQGHSESWRQAETQRLTDPETYEANIQQRMAEMRQQAAAMGAKIDDQRLRWRAEQSYKLGWNQQQTQAILAEYVTEQNGVLKGAAGQTAQELRALALANGVRYSDDWYTKAAQSVVAGTKTPADWEQSIRRQAISAFPQFKDQIEAGMNMDDVASPYKQTMAALLELNGEELDLFDPTIRKALAGRDPKTGAASSKSLWEFENDLRKDARWMQTNNARESFMGTAKTVLEAFGFQG